MKVLKYVLYVVLTLLILFFAMGLLKPSISFGHEIEVDKPASITWAVAQDESKFPLWLEGFKSIELIEGEYGKAGSKYKVVVNPGEGQPDFVMTETIMSIEEFDHIDLSFDSEVMVFEQRVTHTETDGKTKVKTQSKAMGKGIFMKSMFAWMDLLGGSFQAQEVKNIEALKKVIEDNTTDYYPVEELQALPEVDSLSAQ